MVQEPGTSHISNLGQICNSFLIEMQFYKKQRDVASALVAAAVHSGQAHQKALSEAVNLNEHGLYLAPGTAWRLMLVSKHAGQNAAAVFLQICDASESNEWLTCRYRISEQLKKACSQSS